MTSTASTRHPIDETARVAVVGMGCRFPGAPDVDRYWRNLCDGVESVTTFDDAELAAAGVDPQTLADPDYVRSAPVLDGVDEFDAGFFGMGPAEARICDPQQRLFLETAWTALESAGLDPRRADGSVGVFAGSALSTYLTSNLAGNPDVERVASAMQIVLGNDKDSLATRVAHAFDLTGPAYAVQSYCSTSLVAIAGAASSLVAGECDTALAGGSAISVPQRVGYLYQEGGIASPDGHCRAFDANAQGAPLGSGVGVVVLKRLSDALADGDHVHAVLRGWAVNNDGALKVGYTAPGVRGQADAISEAIASAELDPSELDYVEAHGTGTALGDAVEFAALTRAFGDGADCVLGSVKTNVGHLDRAAGVAGVIKTSMAIEHGVLPPTLHFTEPNPQIDLDGAGFRVQTELTGWPGDGENRVAGVSSFGIGGTNAHVVLERAPATPDTPVRDTARPRVLVLSARTAAAADRRVEDLAAHLRAGQNADQNADLDAVAQTLSLGRGEFEHRRAAVVADGTDAVRVLGGDEPGRLHRAPEVAGAPPVTLAFGDGDLAPLGAALWAAEPEFARAVRECEPDDAPPELAGLADAVADGREHPGAAVATGYAVGRLLGHWGVSADELVGRGSGVAVAAALAGTVTLLDAFRAAVAGTAPSDTGVRSEPAPADGDGPEPLVVDVSGGLGDPATALDGADPAGAHDLLARLWTAGCPVDWRAYHDGEQPRRVPLPTYPFQRESYWIDAPGTPDTTAGTASGGRLPVQDWCRVPTWSAEPVDGGFSPGGPVLVLADDGPTAALGAALTERLDVPVVVVTPDGDDLRFRADRPGDAERLVEALAQRGTLPTGVVHLRCLTGGPPAADRYRPDVLDTERRRGLDELVELTRALAAHGATDVWTTVVADHLHAATPGDEIHPGRAALLGACLCVPQELPGWSFRTVDVTGVDPSEEALADLVAAELGPPTTDTAVAHRDGERLVARHAPLDDGPEAPEATALPDGAVCLITGGFGGVGETVAEHLARTVDSPRLVLTSRTPPEDDSDPADPRAGTVTRLRELGAEVLVVAADGSRPDSVRSAVAAARERFGHVDAVLHAAGRTDPDAFAPIQTLDTGSVDEHFAAKVATLAVLNEALADDPPEVTLLFSSIAAVLGGLGATAYAGANAVLNAWATSHRGGPARVVAGDWDTWAHTAEKMSEQDSGGGAVGASMTEFSMTVDEGLGVVDRLLRTSAPVVVVSTGDLDERLTQWVHGSPEDPGGTAIPAAGSDTRDVLRRMTLLWQDVLGVDVVGPDDNFFDLGGNSLMGLQLLKQAGREFGTSLPAVALFESPTVRALTRSVAGDESADREGRSRGADRPQDADVAVIGMAGRFPGATDVGRFWENLREGRESISFFDDDELRASGVDEREFGRDGYVPARPVLDDVAGFDAAFFGYSPREAELTDPQHRIFLETCWHALEDAGHAAGTGGDVGVYGGTNISTYLHRLGAAGVIDEGVSDYQVVIGNDKDALTTSVSYKLDLTGPSMSVQTFCSTSLLAVHLGVRALRGGECRTALAGGVSVRVPDRVGHQYVEGGMESPDGHVRTFDAAARGSMFGDGAAVLVLKRLSDAIADGDTVRAVIKGSAVNNDGSLKVGFTAPSVSGQAEVVARALADADVDPASVSYVEAHGTATELGDPIEMASLHRAFAGVPAGRHTAVGSVKSNIGHLDRAAGASGLIKTVLSLEHGQIPASLHYTEPNPEIDFESGPFYVNDTLSEWTPADGAPRRAGINSLGMGGTNVHVIVEEAPEQEPTSPGREQQLLVLSARSDRALERASADLADHLADRNGDTPLADVAWSLQVGRKAFAQRRVVRATTVDEAVAGLRGEDPERTLTRSEPLEGRPVAMMFAGVGEQYVGMAAELYESEPVFAAAVDECREIVEPLIETDLREVLFADDPDTAGGDGLSAMLGRDGGPTAAERRLAATTVLHPAVFTVEYALGRLFQAWGVRAEAYAGYSLGEYVAATFAGVLELSDALRLVSYRAALIDALPGGGMTAVALSREDVEPRLGDQLDIAAVNADGQCVVAGPDAALDAFAAAADRDGIAHRRLDTSHAFHSRMLARASGALTEWVTGQVTPSAPHTPYLSNVTGTWTTAEQAVDPGYWAQHMCEPVRFADGIGELLADPDRLLLEIGAGQSLGAFVRQHGDCTPERMPLVLPTLPARHDPIDDAAAVHGALGRLWLSGVDVDWHAHHDGERRRRIPLPTYPFDHERYWVDAPSQPAAGRGGTRSAAELVASAGGMQQALTDLPREAPERWFHLPVWAQTVAPQPVTPSTERPWLVLADDRGVADAVVATLRRAGADVHVARRSSAGPDEHAVRPDEPDDVDALVEHVAPGSVLNLWPLDRPSGDDDDPGVVYRGALWLSRALCRRGAECRLVTVSDRAHDVTGVDDVRPASAAVTGPARVTPLEQTSVVSRQVDVDVPDGEAVAARVAGQVLGEFEADPADTLVAWRGTRRWLPRYERLPAAGAVPDAPAWTPLREGGTYLVTGGLGGVGLNIAQGLTAVPGVRIALLGRSALPERDQWTELLDTADPDDPVRRRIETVLDLEGRGAEVAVLAADVTDPQAVACAVAEVRERFGGLDGVVHAAGVPGMGLLQFKEPDDADTALGPKVHGTRVLLDAVADEKPDFVALFSSITSITGGGPGQVDYCSANAYLDAVAHRAAADGGPRVVSIDWGEWQWNAWDEGLRGYADDVARFFVENRRRQGITAEEGWTAFLGALRADQPQVIVSTQDFSVIAEMSRSFTIDSVLDRPADGPTHPRPQLGTSYVAPGTEAEQTIAALWSSALGTADVGIHDNFFELGGNSLLGVELVAKVRQAFELEALAPHVLYQSPTVAALAATVVGGSDVDATDRRERGERRRERARARRNR